MYICTVITSGSIVVVIVVVVVVVVAVVVIVVVSYIQRIGCQPEKTTLHGGQFQSWSAEEQGKETKRKKMAAYPPSTPHTARSEKQNKTKKSRDASTGATQVSVGLASVQGYLRLVD